MGMGEVEPLHPPQEPFSPRFPSSFRMAMMIMTQEAVSDPVFAAELARVLLPGLTKCVQDEFDGYRQESTSVVGDVGSDMKAIRKQLEGLKAELIRREWRIDSLTEDIRVTQEKLDIARGAVVHDLKHLTRATASSIHRKTSPSGSPLRCYRQK